MSIDASQFKQALRYWASGVTVVTVQSAQGPKGMTATSFSSVSVDPPQILVCLNQSSDTGAEVIAQAFFAVNILTGEQQSLSNQFAGGASQEERFAETAWTAGETGAPIFTDALVSLECKLVQQVIAGTHWVVIGEVEKVHIMAGDPLLYYNGTYRQIAGE